MPATAIAEINRCSGSQFNPKLAELFVGVVPVISASSWIIGCRWSLYASLNFCKSWLPD